jgi:hypothetical protein
VRYAFRLTIDAAILEHGSGVFDFDALTVAAGPQLWLRATRTLFVLLRLAAGGSVVLHEVPAFRSYDFTPTVDAAVGLAFDLQ